MYISKLRESAEILVSNTNLNGIVLSPVSPHVQKENSNRSIHMGVKFTKHNIKVSFYKN